LLITSDWLASGDLCIVRVGFKGLGRQLWHLWSRLQQFGGKSTLAIALLNG